jgi:DNA-binding transcriptional regulator YhcF (GntR family)
MSYGLHKSALISALVAVSFVGAPTFAQASQSTDVASADKAVRVATHHPSHPNIPNPNDVDVTRENLHRIINALLDAGLNRKEIKRWLYAAIDNDPKIPNPGDVTVTRENIRRIINALKNAGLNRQQIKRWLKASLDQQIDHPSRREHAARRRAANNDTPARDIRRDDVRPRGARDMRPARDSRPQRIDRIERPDRPTRIERPARPERPERPSRPRGAQ